MRRKVSHVNKLDSFSRRCQLFISGKAGGVYKMVKSRTTGFLSTYAFALVVVVLALEYNDHVVAADQTSVSGDSILLSHDSTNHPPLPFPSTTKAPKCDRMFISNPNGPRNGTFNSPEFKNPSNHSRQCIYTFIAAANERVQITFTNFNLRGTPPDGSTAGTHPECNHEYLDLYTEIEEPDADLITTPFGGRYCGKIPPRKRISMYRVLVIGFYTDKLTVENVFQGMYDFIDTVRFEIGTPSPLSPCGFTIYSDQKKEGNFCSPTYPGVYPKSLNCFYKFLGGKNQRVRLEFMDFDLFYGGSHCPFDYIKVHDGPDANAPVIGRYCAQQRNLVVYSSTENLFVQFITLERTADSQNRGFLGNFEFSERYVNLGFIFQGSKNDGQHIRGSECDQTILSKKESNGTVYSPNYPFLYYPNTICRYFIYGLQDMQNLERVRLEFEKFEIPGGEPGCTDSYLKLYLRGQENIQAFDKHDHSFCGRDLPPSVVSEGPRLFMVFNSGTAQGQGFKARYIFETEYQVPGTAAPDGSCNFTYLSSSHMSGDFNSPRHPANYPSNLSCLYTMQGQPGEQIRLVFEQLQLKTLSTIQYGNSCQNDWLEVYDVGASGSDRLIGRYCGYKSPGPIVTDLGNFLLKVLFHSDKNDVDNGFKARYTFQPEESISKHCGQNVSGQEDGIITSPGYPEKYGSGLSCHWYISVKPHHRVLLLFTNFVLEGAQITANDTGCPNAVVRIWKNENSLPIELCGQQLSKTTQEIHSERNVLRISFITADKTLGNRGFHAVWTEVREGPSCDKFRCGINGYCISEHLHCNRVPNCGFDDNSDESTCDLVEQNGIQGEEPSGLDLYLLGGVVIGVSVLLLMSICVWCHRKHKRRRDEPHPHEIHHRRVCDAAGARFSSVDSV